jgi:C1A family cysteine protease
MAEDYRTIPLGWLPDMPDPRDLLYAERVPLRDFVLPTSVDLRHRFPKANSQGRLGSCTAQAASCALEYLDRINGRTIFDHSRLYLYYNGRIIKDRDTGEEKWPYNVDVFADRPPDDCYREGQLRQAVEYLSVSPGELREVLAEGFPITFGFTVFDSFYETDDSGNIPEPSGSANGGHAVLLVGYDNNRHQFIIRNSWSERWGKNGYGFMSYATMAAIGRSHWVVRKIEDGTPDPPPTPRPEPRRICPWLRSPRAARRLRQARRRRLL